MRQVKWNIVRGLGPRTRYEVHAPVQVGQRRRKEEVHGRQMQVVNARILQNSSPYQIKLTAPPAPNFRHNSAVALCQQTALACILCLPKVELGTCAWLIGLLSVIAASGVHPEDPSTATHLAIDIWI